MVLQEALVLRVPLVLVEQQVLLVLQVLAVRVVVQVKMVALLVFSHIRQTLFLFQEILETDTSFGTMRLR